MKNKVQKVTALAIIVWLFALIFYLYEFFLRTFVGTVADDVISNLKLSAETFSIMGAGYYLTYGLMQMPAGYLTDKFGAKKVILFASSLCAFSVILFSFATGFWTAFTARLLMGLGSSFGFLTLLVVVTTWFPKSKYSLFLGYSQILGTLGPIIAAGPLAAFLSHHQLSWRTALFQIGIFGVLFTIVMLFTFKSKPRDGFQHMVYIGHKNSVWTQLKNLVRNKQAWLVAFYSATVYESVDFLGAIWGTLYLQSHNFTQVSAAYTISIAWAGFAFGCPFLTWISDKLEKRKPIMILGALIGLISSVLTVYINFENLWVYRILFFFIGVAAGSLNLGITIVVEHVLNDVKPLALGLHNGMIILFGAIIPPLASILIKTTNLSQLVPEDFKLGFTMLPLLYCASLILVIFFIKETYCKPQKEMIILNPNQN